MRLLFLCEYGYAFAMLYSRLKEGDQVQTDDIQTSVRVTLIIVLRVQYICFFCMY